MRCGEGRGWQIVSHRPYVCIRTVRLGDAICMEDTDMFARGHFVMYVEVMQSVRYTKVLALQRLLRIQYVDPEG